MRGVVYWWGMVRCPRRGVHVKCWSGHESDSDPRQKNVSQAEESGTSSFYSRQVYTMMIGLTA